MEAFAAAEAAQTRREARDAERPLADIMLRADADGTTALVHRGVLCSYSRVFREALLSTPVTEVLPLPGTHGAELDVLTAWIYREAKPFTKVRR